MSLEPSQLAFIKNIRKEMHSKQGNYHVQRHRGSQKSQEDQKVPWIEVLKKVGRGLAVTARLAVLKFFTGMLRQVLRVQIQFDPGLKQCHQNRVFFYLHWSTFLIPFSGPPWVQEDQSPLAQIKVLDQGLFSIRQLFG